MRAHTRKHPTDRDIIVHETDKNEVLVDWRNSFSDLFAKFSEPGVALRGFRLREGWTQTELAEKVSIEQPNLSKMESGKRVIGKALAMRFAALFKTDYRIFL